MRTVYSYAEMRRLNGNESYSACDHMYYVASGMELPIDFISCLADILYPKISIIDGVALVNPTGAVQRYKTYISDGQRPEDAQYWANLLETTELIGVVDVKTGLKLARGIAACWRSALEKQHPGLGQKVEVLEGPNGEVFVVLRSGWPEPST